MSNDSVQRFRETTWDFVPACKYDEDRTIRNKNNYSGDDEEVQAPFHSRGSAWAGQSDVTSEVVSAKNAPPYNVVTDQSVRRPSDFLTDTNIIHQFLENSRVILREDVPMKSSKMWGHFYGRTSRWKPPVFLFLILVSFTVFGKSTCLTVLTNVTACSCVSSKFQGTCVLCCFIICVFRGTIPLCFSVAFVLTTVSGCS